MKTFPQVIEFPPVYINETMKRLSEYDAALKVLNRQMDDELLMVREKYAADITLYQASKDDLMAEFEQFVKMNEAGLFKDKRSFETIYGIFGIRTSKPRLALLPGFKWPAVTKSLERLLPAYIRTTVEPAKDKLLADRNIPYVSALFPGLGVTVVQEENFFVDLN